MKLISQTGDRQMTNRAKLAQAKEALKAAGWLHVCSTTRSPSRGLNYGLLFSNCKKGDENQTFHLNVETMEALPV